jgi:glutamate/tyrosine decarboxylase-like PLP-dependent enzyme
MSDPLHGRDELERALALAAREARAYLEDIEDDAVQPPGSSEALDGVASDFPDDGDGALEPLAELADLGHRTATRSSGPRFFHFVIGGTTPAAVAADWLASALDQNAGAWHASQLAARLELIAVDWLRQLFELPPEFRGILVTGGTMANFMGLAAARDWCADRQGVDVAQEGLSALPPIPVLSSGYVHSSAVKSLALLGVGKRNVRRLTRDAAGRLDLDALEAELAGLGGSPAIVIANAGEVNAGDFDPIEPMADLAERHGAWLHVDGAFGLFSRVSPRSAHLAAGAERANSVSSDGHKWLNVPHDVGFAFIRERDWLLSSFAEQAAYLPPVDDPRPNLGYRSPEGSRRARAFVVWATLRAYGRSGYRAMVERHLDLARHLARRIDDEPEFERLAEGELNIVCFRWRPERAGEEELDDLNRRLGEALLEDGRVLAGTTIYEGKVAFRPAIVNWRTREEDVDLLVDVLLELAHTLDGCLSSPKSRSRPAG